MKKSDSYKYARRRNRPHVEEKKMIIYKSFGERKTLQEIQELTGISEKTISELRKAWRYERTQKDTGFISIKEQFREKYDREMSRIEAEEYFPSIRKEYASLEEYQIAQLEMEYNDFKSLVTSEMIEAAYMYNHVLHRTMEMTLFVVENLFEKIKRTKNISFKDYNKIADINIKLLGAMKIDFYQKFLNSVATKQFQKIDPDISITDNTIDIKVVN